MNFLHELLKAKFPKLDIYHDNIYQTLLEIIILQEKEQLSNIFRKLIEVILETNKKN
jgi:hypothetical protein